MQNQLLTFFFLLTSVQDCLLAQTRLLQIGGKLKRKVSFSQLSVHPSDLGVAWQSYPRAALHGTGRNWLLGTYWRTLEQNRYIHFSVLQIPKFQISQFYGHPFNLPITMMLTWHVTSTE